MNKGQLHENHADIPMALAYNETINQSKQLFIILIRAPIGASEYNFI